MRKIKTTNEEDHRTCKNCFYDAGPAECNHPDNDNDLFWNVPMRFCFKDKGGDNDVHPSD